MVHAEIAYTMARYLYKKLRPNDAEISMNLQNFEYHEPVVARKSTDREQIIHTEAVLDLFSNRVHFRWFNVEAGHWYSCATIDFESADFWLADWARVAHLVTCRIDSLKELADRGKASKLARQLAYRLFASLVDWSEVFQGMQSVVLDQMEAFADVQLSLDNRGKWYIAPWHMESLVALSAFILNCTEVLDNKNYFFITPGYKSMRFAKPLKPGGLYRSYVKMLPTSEPNMYAGDVYILDGSDVVGMIERILFRKWPRTMINRFFVPPDMKKAVMSKSKSGDSRADKPVVTKDLCLPFERQSYADRSYPYADNSHPPPGKNHLAPEKDHHGYPATTNIKAYTHPDNPKATPNGVRAMTNGVGSMPNSVGTFTTGIGMPAKLRTIHTTCEAPKREATAKSSIVSHALAIISEETAVEVAELTEDASFLDLGIDSLMSLVLAQKFRSEIGVDVRDSLFIEFPTIGHLCQLLEKN
jgi:iterative type I PKS product template protein